MGSVLSLLPRLGRPDWGHETAQNAPAEKNLSENVPRGLIVPMEQVYTYRNGGRAARESQGGYALLQVGRNGWIITLEVRDYLLIHSY